MFLDVVILLVHNENWPQATLHVTKEVGVVDVVKALALLVEIVIEPVRVPVTATKMNIGMTPPTEGGPMIQNRTSVEDQLMIAELCLYKKKNTHTQKMLNII